MNKFQKAINSLVKFKKGDAIPNPDNLLKVKCGGTFYISRRSIAHILQKKKIGLYLTRNMSSSLNKPDYVFLSSHLGKGNTERRIYYKGMNIRSIAVVVEYRESKFFIVTAMITRVKYLNNKYKKLR